MTLVTPFHFGGGRASGGEGYRVVRGEHGIAVYGPVPLTDAAALTRAWEEHLGLDTMDVGVATALGAVMAVGDAEGLQRWRVQLDALALRQSGGDAELCWALGTDTGTSSLTIMLTLGSSPAALARVAERLHSGPPGPRSPQDPDDLGRCVRLLALFDGARPPWRQRLDHVAHRHPEWAPLVARWEELEAAYRAGLKTGDQLATMNLMRECRGEPPLPRGAYERPAATFTHRPAPEAADDPLAPLDGALELAEQRVHLMFAQSEGSGPEPEEMRRRADEAAGTLEQARTALAALRVVRAVSP